MLNLIRSQLYSIRHDRYMHICLTILLAIPVITIVSLLKADNGSAMTGSEAFCRSFSESGGMVPSIISLLIASRVSGWDFNDKTINYEVVYGHKRGSIYWTRVLLAILISIPAAWLAALFPALLFTAINGWGTMLDQNETILRSVLMLLPLLRIVALFCFFSILLRNSWAALVIGYLCIVGEIMIGFFTKNTSFFLALTDLQTLLYFENMVIDTANNASISYNDTLSSSLIIGTIVMSVITAAAFLIGGRLLFGKRDMQ